MIMSMVPLGGLIGSAAGAPLSQAKGSESERAQKESLAQSRQSDSALQAERAAGIGQTDEDQETSERDADGRRLWERPRNGSDSPATDSTTAAGRLSKDASRQSGGQLDLTG
jgi:hypothetical protein